MHVEHHRGALGFANRRRGEERRKICGYRWDKGVGERGGLNGGYRGMGGEGAGDRGGVEGVGMK